MKLFSSVILQRSELHIKFNMQCILTKKQVTDRKACGLKQKKTSKILQKFELSTSFHTWDWLLTFLYYPSVFIKYFQTVCNFT